MDKQKGAQLNIIKKIVELALPKKRLVLLSFLLSVINVAAALVAPLFVGYAINYAVGAGNVDFSGLLRMCAVLFFVYIIGTVSSYYVAYINNKLTQYAVKNMRDKLMEKLHILPLSEIDSRLSGDFIGRVVADVDVVGEGILQGFTQAFTGVLSIIGIMAFMLYINVITALAVILLTPLSIFIAMFISRRIQRFFRTQSAKLGQLSGHVEEAIRGQRTLIAFNAQSASEKTFNDINDEHAKNSIKANFYSSIINPTTRFVNNIVYMVCGIIGLLLGLNVGAISSFLIYSNQYARPFNELSSVFSQLQSALASAERVLAFLQLPNLSPDGELSVDNCRGAVEFKDVSFSYTADVPLISGFNLKVQPGQKVAIVGPTGSGKTTLTNLLMRFYEIDGGSITIDGKDIRILSRQSLRSCFGMVLQETWLINATIRENIAYSRPDASLKDIMQAAEFAHCHDFIMEKQHGYDTYIGENHSGLSEGQRQLLSIARVMLADAPMLILDEATSSIDTLTEHRVQQAFDYITRGKTSFVIAHRLSTIIKADIILMLKDGNIVEQGTHEQLLSRGGEYAELYNSQFANIDGA